MRRARNGSGGGGGDAVTATSAGAENANDHTTHTYHHQQDERRSVVECADTKPEECESLRYALFACKRGQVDARSRIQGNKGY